MFGSIYIITLRPITEADLEVFYQQQLDAEANLMAAFPARNREAFFYHWETRVLGNESVVKKAITFDDKIVGHILCWERSDRKLIGYWFGKEYWGRGLATEALKEFLIHLETRPLYAHVAKHNIASVRVLEKCGFKISNVGIIFSEIHGHEIEEQVMIIH